MALLHLEEDLAAARQKLYQAPQMGDHHGMPGDYAATLSPLVNSGLQASGKELDKLDALIKSGWNAALSTAAQALTSGALLDQFVGGTREEQEVQD